VAFLVFAGLFLFALVSRTGVLTFAVVSVVGGFGLTIAGNLGLLVLAFGESAGCGVLTLLVPCYAFYYAVTRRGNAMGFLLTGISGGIMATLAAAFTPALLAMHEIREREGRPPTAVGSPLAKNEPPAHGDQAARPAPSDLSPAPAPARPQPQPKAQADQIQVTLSNGRVTPGRMGSPSPFGLTFQVDYRAGGGPIAPGPGRYFWVIRTRHGLASDPMPLRLGGEGTLSGSAMQLKREDGPFESYVEMGSLGPFGARQKVSNTVPLVWVDAPQPSRPASPIPRQGLPTFPRGPFGRGRR
jgi:hypothetical protein